VVELHGSRELYSLHLFNDAEGSLNAAIIYDTATARGDLIAVLENVSSELSLDGAGFIFA
jgi:hypothetical protein